MFKIKANLRKRILATIIDYSYILLFSYFYIDFFGDIQKDGSKSVRGLLAMPIPLVWFLYFVLVESAYGATFGHQLLGLKVLTVGRKNIDFSHSLKRHLLDSIDILLYGIPAFIAITNSEKKQRLGDMWAQTICVNTKDSEQYNAAIDES